MSIYGDYVIARYDFSLITKYGSDEYTFDSYRESMAEAMGDWNYMLDSLDALGDVDVAGGIYQVGNRIDFVDVYDEGYTEILHPDKYMISGIAPMKPGYGSYPRGNVKLSVTQLPWHFRTVESVPVSADYFPHQNWIDVFIYAQWSIPMTLVTEIARYFGVDETWVTENEQVFGIFGRENEYFTRFTIGVRDPERNCGLLPGQEWGE